MIFLLLSILCSTLIYTLFKLAGSNRTHLLSIITINYLTATLTSFAFGEKLDLNSILHQKWLIIALIIGILFVIMFFLIGFSTQKAGITVTTMATRMSLIIPVTVSMFLYDEPVTNFKVITLIIAFIGIILSVYKKPDKHINIWILWLPFILFMGSGTVDALVKVAQNDFIAEEQLSQFSGSLFFFSFIIATIILITSGKANQVTHKNNLIFGILLGLVNLGSLVFLIKALNQSNLDSSFVFTCNNVAIVILSTLLGLVYFKEKISIPNSIGIGISIISILLIFR